MVFQSRATSARVVTISQTYRPAPNSRHSPRKDVLVMPAIGASTTGGHTGNGPICRTSALAPGGATAGCAVAGGMVAVLTAPLSRCHRGGWTLPPVLMAGWPGD